MWNCIFTVRVNQTLPKVRQRWKRLRPLPAAARRDPCLHPAESQAAKPDRDVAERLGGGREFDSPAGNAAVAAHAQHHGGGARGWIPGEGESSRLR